MTYLNGWTSIIAAATVGLGLAKRIRFEDQRTMWYLGLVDFHRCPQRLKIIGSLALVGMERQNWLSLGDCDHRCDHEP